MSILTLNLDKEERSETKRFLPRFAVVLQPRPTDLREKKRYNGTAYLFHNSLLSYEKVRHQLNIRLDGVAAEIRCSPSSQNVIINKKVADAAAGAGNEQGLALH